MKTIAIVPIKLNNERLPNKNTKPFDNGKPLCCYIFDTLIAVGGIDEIYVYCSNDKIINYIPKSVKYLKRDPVFDTPQAKMNEILKKFADDVDGDIYVMTHATSPFVSAESISKGLDKVKTEGYDSALAVEKIQKFLWKDGEPFNYDLVDIPRTQDLPKLYNETSGFYVYKRDVIVKHNRRIGFNPYLVEISKIEGIDIDDAEDFEIANAIYNSKRIGK